MCSQSLEEFDKDNIPDAVIKKLKKYVDDPSYTPDSECAFGVGAVRIQGDDVLGSGTSPDVKKVRRGRPSACFRSDTLTPNPDSCTGVAKQSRAAMRTSAMDVYSRLA